MIKNHTYGKLIKLSDYSMTKNIDLNLLIFGKPVCYFSHTVKDKLSAYN